MFPNSKKVERYTILSYRNAGALRNAVEQHMRNGFQPYGAVLVFGGEIHQPMVAYAKSIHFFAVVDKDTDTSQFESEEV